MPTGNLASHDTGSGAPGHRPRRRLRALFFVVTALLLAGPGATSAQDGNEDAGKEVPYTRKGADTCLRCHDTAHIQSIFRTPHAEAEDPDAPMAKLQCETCHGPGGDHGQRLRAGEERPPILNFGSDEPYPVAEQNAVCLRCHESDVTGGWHGGVHDRALTSCADCHTSHAARDPVLVKEQQARACYDCHTRQRAQFQRAFSHPVRFGEMACSDCHAPHDSFTPALLEQATLNQTCYQCHAEKRGPSLWEHPPASEDCTNCHRPHGSNHRDLLTKAKPLLCQDCHSRAGHPSVQYSGRGLPGRQASQFVVGGSCTNCHSRVHGSNHPSGANLTR